MALNKDTLLNAVLASGKMHVMYNNNGDPLYMVRIPKFNIEDIDPSLGSGVHPAFIVGGVVKNEIYIGAFPATFEKGCAISIPDQLPQANINFDQAKAACFANGAGFHMMTNWEWSAVALWCLKNAFQPRGNTAWGKAHDAGYETGLRLDGRNPGEATGDGKTLGGSGPLSWRHNNDISGIADLVGNVWEWQDGLKIVDGKVYMPTDNDFNLAEAQWPNPTGDQVVLGNNATWKDMTTSFGSVSDAVRKMLAQAMVVPNVANGSTPLSIYGSAKGGFWIDKTAERLPVRGGPWSTGVPAGLACLALSDARSDVGSTVGCRPAFIL